MLLEGSFDYRNLTMKYKGLRLKFYSIEDVYTLSSIFVDSIYDKFNFHGKCVVDIGAYIGGSSIFFARKGARKIIAFEPNPTIFEVLLENIKVNNFENIIKAYNIAVGEVGTITLYIPQCPLGATTLIEKVKARSYNNVNTVKVKSISIKEVIQKEILIS